MVVPYLNVSNCIKSWANVKCLFGFCIRWWLTLYDSNDSCLSWFLVLPDSVNLFDHGALDMVLWRTFWSWHPGPKSQGSPKLNLEVQSLANLNKILRFASSSVLVHFHLFRLRKVAKIWFTLFPIRAPFSTGSRKSLALK